MEYSKIAYYAALFANDLRHITLHAAGSSMEEIRSTASSLCYKAQSDFEDLSKMAIINNEKIGNLNDIRSYVADTEWKSITTDAVDFNAFNLYVSINGQQYLNQLKNIEEKSREIEDRIKYWEEAVVYDNGQRMAVSQEPTPVEEEPKGFAVESPMNSQPQEAVVIAIPDWRSIGATSALSQSVLGN